MLDRSTTKYTKRPMAAAGATSGTISWYVSDNIRGAVAEYTEQTLKNPNTAPDGLVVRCVKYEE